MASEAAAALAAQTGYLKSIPAESVVLLERAAREAAAAVRAQAAQSRHSVSVRVVARQGGVRVTVQGPQAARYRALIERELNARVPDIKAEIRAKVTRKSR